MSRWPNGMAGMVVHYGTGEAHTELDPELFDIPLVPSTPDPLSPEEVQRFLTAPAAAEPKTVEEAAKAFADAMADESVSADRHRDALARADEAHRLALARVAKLAEAHIAAREATAAAKAKVVELAKGEP